MTNEALEAYRTQSEARLRYVRYLMFDRCKAMMGCVYRDVEGEANALREAALEAERRSSLTAARLSCTFFTLPIVSPYSFSQKFISLTKLWKPTLHLRSSTFRFVVDLLKLFDSPRFLYVKRARDNNATLAQTASARCTELERAIEQVCHHHRRRC